MEHIFSEAEVILGVDTHLEFMSVSSSIRWAASRAPTRSQPMRRDTKSCSVGYNSLAI